MPFIIADRVRETSTTVGTGSIALAGAVTGYQSFDAVLDTADTTFYTIADQGGPNWEVGIGTFTAPSTLARTTILSSSNGGSLVNFTAGTKDVFISLPASKTNVEDQPNLIEVNSSSAALRITQTGAGNALLVEDSANPDATPFVVDTQGRLISGYTVPIASIAGLTARIQVAATDASGAFFGSARFGAHANAGGIDFSKSRGADVGVNGLVQSGDTLGQIRFAGDDGAAFLQAASILAAVDGTPGTNDMPGRLVFSTTADGASSPTERMRINSAGEIGIGATSTTGYRIRLGGSLTGATTAYGISPDLAVASDVTTLAIGFHTNIATQAASFTLPNLRHYSTRQSTISAGSAVTNQYGFWADSTLVGATNNFGFYSNIAASTGRWNFYANGTADNYFNGNVSVGTTTAVSKVTVNGDVAGTFFVNPTTVSANYTIPTNYNAMTAGPITVNSGVTVTVGSGSVWTVI